MDVNKDYQEWLKNVREPSLLSELKDLLGNEDEIYDRFYQDLQFGTGGLRGKLGVGSNRMNIYTVARATAGLAAYLLTGNTSPSVAIAYDTRNMSREFAEVAAGVMVSKGIRVHMYSTTHPTPMLSFAVRHLKADSGIVITASHNPKEYNGYKVYGSDGGQITDNAAASILENILAADMFALPKTSFAETAASPLFSYIGEEVDSSYYDLVSGLINDPQMLKSHAAELKIIYSPLHGSGNIPVRQILSKLGFSSVFVVPEQEKPDGDFPTTPYPNPEEPSVFTLAANMARDIEPDLIFATDPDCDRIGVMAKNPSGEFVVMTGNQIGALLVDYIIKRKTELKTMPKSPAVIKTIVTSDFANAVCEENNVALFETLTGFKYIGELAGSWEKTGEHSFLFGFEESYGYLAGSFVRDKDAVIAAALIAEMSLYYKLFGQTLYSALLELYKKSGAFCDRLISVTLPGAEGQERIKTVIDRLRGSFKTLLPQGDGVSLLDYKLSTKTSPEGEVTPLSLPKSNVLKFVFADKSWLVFRPSGTEPKMKIYICAKGSDLAAAEKRAAELALAAEEAIK